MPDTNTIALFDWEIRAILSGKLTTLVRAMDPQPVAQPSAKAICPFGQPGDLLVGLEDWGWSIAQNRQVIKTVHYSDWRDSDTDIITWQPASTMPPELSRFKWTVAGG